MVLDANAPHLTEESSANKTVRSDRFVSTLCRPNLATWRHKVSHEAFYLIFDHLSKVFSSGNVSLRSRISPEEFNR